MGGLDGLRTPPRRSLRTPCARRLRTRECALSPGPPASRRLCGLVGFPAPSPSARRRCYFYPCLPCSIYGNRVEFKGKWWAYVDEGSPAVLLGQAPLFASQLDELESLGVGAIVNLCDEFKGLGRQYSKRKISLLWLKTVDHLEPTVEAMRTACSFIE